MYVVYKYQTPKAFGSAKYCTSGDQNLTSRVAKPRVRPDFSHECSILHYQTGLWRFVFVILYVDEISKGVILKQKIVQFGHFLGSFNFSVKLQFSNNILKKSFKEKTPKKPFFKILIFVYRAVVENTARLMRLPCSSGKYCTVNYIIKFRLPYSISKNSSGTFSNSVKISQLVDTERTYLYVLILP